MSSVGTVGLYSYELEAEKGLFLVVMIDWRGIFVDCDFGCL